MLWFYPIVFFCLVGLSSCYSDRLRLATILLDHDKNEPATLEETIQTLIELVIFPDSLVQKILARKDDPQFDLPGFCSEFMKDTSLLDCAEDVSSLHEIHLCVLKKKGIPLAMLELLSDLKSPGSRFWREPSPAFSFPPLSRWTWKEFSRYLQINNCDGCINRDQYLAYTVLRCLDSVTAENAHEQDLLEVIKMYRGPLSEILISSLKQPITVSTLVMAILTKTFPFKLTGRVLTHVRKPSAFVKGIHKNLFSSILSAFTSVTNADLKSLGEVLLPTVWKDVAGRREILASFGRCFHFPPEIFPLMSPLLRLAEMPNVIVITQILSNIITQDAKITSTLLRIPYGPFLFTSNWAKLKPKIQGSEKAVFLLGRMWPTSFIYCPRTTSLDAYFIQKYLKSQVHEVIGRLATLITSSQGFVYRRIIECLCESDLSDLDSIMFQIWTPEFGNQLDSSNAVSLGLQKILQTNYPMPMNYAYQEVMDNIRQVVVESLLEKVSQQQYTPTILSFFQVDSLRSFSLVEFILRHTHRYPKTCYWIALHARDYNDEVFDISVADVYETVQLLLAFIASECQASQPHDIVRTTFNQALLKHLQPAGQLAFVEALSYETLRDYYTLTLNNACSLFDMMTYTSDACTEVGLHSVYRKVQVKLGIPISPFPSGSTPIPFTLLLHLRSLYKAKVMSDALLHANSDKDNDPSHPDSLSNRQQRLISDPEAICAICLESFVSIDDISILASCKHSFHSHCLERHLDYRSDCPVCRGNLKPQLPTNYDYSADAQDLEMFPTD